MTDKHVDDAKGRVKEAAGSLTDDQDLKNEGKVDQAKSSVKEAPGIPVPFVAAVVDCDGTSVKGNIINTEPDAEHVRLGMKVRLATTSVGFDDDGVEAINYGFEPV